MVCWAALSCLWPAIVAVIVACRSFGGLVSRLWLSVAVPVTDSVAVPVTVPVAVSVAGWLQVRELRKLHREANQRQKTSPRVADEARKWLDWPQFLAVVEVWWGFGHT